VASLIGDHGRRSRLRLRARLAWALGALAAAIVATVAVTSLTLVETTLERHLAARLDRLERDARRRIERTRREVETRLDALEAALRTQESETLGRWLTDGAGADRGPSARRLMRTFDLDALAVLDEAGTVLVSGDWPEQAGRRNPSLDALPAGAAVARMLQGRERAAPVLAARRSLRLGARRIDLVGAVGLDGEFLDPLADDAPVLLHDERGELVGTAGPRAVAPLARAVRFVEPGDRLGLLTVAVDRSGSDALVRRLRTGFLELGAIVTLAAALAGAWVAHGVTRPIESLVRSVDSIARGEADYTFPRQAGHELDELVASFSRLHRSLSEQQQRALAAERVAAWREAARRVAHEINNPLVPIRLTVENLRKARTRAPERFDEMFAEGTATILEEVQQLQRLVSEFSEFARLPAPRPVATDLDALVDNVLALYRAEARLRVVRQGGGLPPAMVDPEQLSRVVKNLVQNAVDAMGGEGGELRVETAEEQGAARLTVADRGPGFSAEALSRWTEPYFTTRSSGTGLGSAIANRIVAEHGGTLEAANRSGGGARVTVRLPLRFEGRGDR